MASKKHRIVLEVSSNVPMTEKDVRNGINLLLSRLGEGHWHGKWLKPWSNNGVERLKIGEVKSFSRVFIAEAQKRFLEKVG